MLSWTRIRIKFSKTSSASDGFHRVGSLHTKDIPLETQILATSAKAEGKFLGTQDLEWQESGTQSKTEVWAAETGAITTYWAFSGSRRCPPREWRTLWLLLVLSSIKQRCFRQYLLDCLVSIVDGFDDWGKRVGYAQGGDHLAQTSLIAKNCGSLFLGSGCLYHLHALLDDCR